MIDLDRLISTDIICRNGLDEREYLYTKYFGFEEKRRKEDE